MKAKNVRITFSRGPISGRDLWTPEVWSFWTFGWSDINTGMVCYSDYNDALLNLKSRGYPIDHLLEKPKI